MSHQKKNTSKKKQGVAADEVFQWLGNFERGMHEDNKAGHERGTRGQCIFAESSRWHFDVGREVWGMPGCPRTKSSGVDGKAHYVTTYGIGCNDSGIGKP